MAARTVKVKILEHRAVMLEDRLVEAGAIVSVSAVDAKTLIAEGYVERA